jgi:hypothetical protein
VRFGSVVLAVIALVAAQGSGAPAASAPNPANFSAHVDNPWFPLRPGTVYVYRGVKDAQPSMDVLIVTPRVKRIEGVPCVVVEDRLFLSGRLEERTIDWYTQDRQGNVWYFGESTAELDKHGQVTSTEGSWQAGRNGALPGIYMPANPRVGQSDRQELYKGHAEDHFRILGLRAKVKVPYVSSTAALLTAEWTPLEQDVLDHKLYVHGIGNVLEQSVKGPNERNALISVTRR